MPDQPNYDEKYEQTGSAHPSDSPVNPYAATDTPLNFDPSQSGARLPGDNTMVQRITVLAILTFVAAGFEVLMAVMLMLMPLLFMAVDIRENGQRPVGQEQMMLYASIGYGVAGALILAIALLRIFAGMKLMKFEGKKLYLVSIFLGLLPAMTCYCAPTALGIFIFGLIVLLNAGVDRAFTMRRSGLPPQEIRRHFQ